MIADAPEEDIEVIRSIYDEVKNSQKIKNTTWAYVE